VRPPPLAPLENKGGAKRPVDGKSYQKPVGNKMREVPRPLTLTSPSPLTLGIPLLEPLERLSSELGVRFYPVVLNENREDSQRGCLEKPESGR
jgi:hypothetical protein